MRNNERGISLVAVVWILVGLLVFVALGVHFYYAIRGSSVSFPAEEGTSFYYGHAMN
jgi:hypothetical protein